MRVGEQAGVLARGFHRYARHRGPFRVVAQVADLGRRQFQHLAEGGRVAHLEPVRSITDHKGFDQPGQRGLWRVRRKHRWVAAIAREPVSQLVERVLAQRRWSRARRRQLGQRKREQQVALCPARQRLAGARLEIERRASGCEQRPSDVPINQPLEEQARFRQPLHLLEEHRRARRHEIIQSLGKQSGRLEGIAQRQLVAVDVQEGLASVE